MIIFLYGEDTYRSREKLKLLKEKFIREVDNDGSSLATLNGETATMEKINEQLGSPSLFSRKRMIVIENIFANKSKSVSDQLYEYLKSQDAKKTGAKEKAAKAKPDNDNIIIIWDDIDGVKFKSNKLFKFLQAQKFSQEFKPLSNTEATAWIKKEAVSRGAILRQNAAIELTALLGNDLWRLSNELNKLIHYAGGQENKLLDSQAKPAIEVEAVRDLVKGKLDENIFALTDAISGKNKALAIKLFAVELDAGISDSYLMHMIVRQFKILARVRQGLDSGLTERKILNQLKLHPFVLKKSLNQAHNFTLPILKNIILRLIRIDWEIKTGQTDAATALSLLIAKI